MMQLRKMTASLKSNASLKEGQQSISQLEIDVIRLEQDTAEHITSSLQAAVPESGQTRATINSNSTQSVKQTTKRLEHQIRLRGDLQDSSVEIDRLRNKISRQKSQQNRRTADKPAHKLTIDSETPQHLAQKALKVNCKQPQGSEPH